MALTKDQEKWVRDQAEAASKAPLATSRQKWYDRHAGLVVLLGSIAAVVGIGIPVALWLIPHIENDMRNDLGADVDRKLKDKGLDHVSIDIAEVRTRLDEMEPLIRDLIRGRMNSDATLSRQDFSRKLPELRTTLKAAREGNMRSPAEILGNLQKRFMEADQEAPDFWPAVSEFIHYRSLNSASWPSLTKLKRCTDSPPIPTALSVRSPTQMDINPAVYENCEVILDSPEDDERLNKFIPTAFVIRFRNCLIVYNGGPINLMLTINLYNAPYEVPSAKPAAKGTVNVNVDHTLEFQNCVFALKLNAAPPPLGKQLTRLLLANTNPVVKVSPATHS